MENFAITEEERFQLTVESIKNHHSVVYPHCVWIMDCIENTCIYIPISLNHALFVLVVFNYINIAVYCNKSVEFH